MIKYVCAGLGIALIAVSYLYKESQQEIGRLSVEKALIESNLNNAKNSIARQNEAIKAMQVKIESQEIKEVENIREIKILDSTCESELRAYKNLFKELGNVR